MKYRPRYTIEAAARIRKLHPEVKRRARAAIDLLLKSPLGGHALHDELAGLRSYRFGKCRIVFQINEKESTLDILLVGPRRDIYEELRDRVIKDSFG